MAIKENFISMAPDEESNAKVSPIDNNKTLMMDQVKPGDTIVISLKDDQPEFSVKQQ